MSAGSRFPPPPSLAVVLLTLLASSLDQVSGQTLDPHGPPRVDRNPTFLDSFVPAAMQVISHVTELMKYEIPVPEVPTSTSPPSTSSHRPGIFAPEPPKRPPSFYYRSREPPRGSTYAGWVLSGRKTERAGVSNPDWFGRAHSELYGKVNSINDDYEGSPNEREVVDEFLRDYDDVDAPLLRKKKPPPPKAYVTLLSLYDGLNKEAKKLGMNKYAGYTKNVIRDLSEFSKGTSAYEMREIFSKIVERKEVKQENVLDKLNSLIRDLNDPRSYLNDALRYIPPLIFDGDF